MLNNEQDIHYSPTGNSASVDRAREIEHWSLEQTHNEADWQGFQLSQKHLEFILYLRNYYLDHGWPKKPHELTRILDKAFKSVGGSRYLHKLFPGGPLTQGVRLAGLPPLANAIDKSFGTAY